MGAITAPDVPHAASLACTWSSRASKPDSPVSAERKALVKAYGARLIESDPLEGSDGAIHVVRELVAAAPEEG